MKIYRPGLIDGDDDDAGGDDDDDDGDGNSNSSWGCTDSTLLACPLVFQMTCIPLCDDGGDDDDDDDDDNDDHNIMAIIMERLFHCHRLCIFFVIKDIDWGLSSHLHLPERPTPPNIIKDLSDDVIFILQN